MLDARPPLRAEEPSPLPLPIAQPAANRVGTTYLLALLLVTAAVIAPLWIVSNPGMVDYPNHLARCYILAHISGSAVWQQRYTVLHDPLPNLAIDLIVTPLSHLFSIETSGKLFVSLAAILYTAGCSFLAYVATGRRSWIALLAAFTFYNSALLYGFVNYIFGLGVFLIALAFWMHSRRRMTPTRFLICCVLSLAAYLSHLSSITFLAVACITIALLELRSHRKFSLLIPQLAWLACPLLLMSSFMKGSGAVGRIEWSPLREKALHLLTPIRSYNLKIDIAVLVVLLLCVTLVLKKIHIHPIAIAGVVMYLLFLVTPEGLFTGSAVDARYIMPGFLLIVLSIEVSDGRIPRLAFAVALIALLLHTAGIAATWITIDRREQQVLRMGDVLPRGARVYVMHPSPERSAVKIDRGFLHVVTLWAIPHEALVSTLFSSPGMQPLVARQPPCEAVKWLSCMADYDYIWTDAPPSATEATIRTLADPASTWESVTLWRIRRQDSVSRAPVRP